MSAKTEFRKGDRVKLSAEGLAHLRTGRGKRFDRVYDESLRGTIVGSSHYQDCIRVQRDGIKTPDTYSADFWELA